MSSGRRRDWRAICEDVLKERNAERTDALLEELLEALEDRASKRGPKAVDREKPS